MGPETSLPHPEEKSPPWGTCIRRQTADEKIDSTSSIEDDTDTSAQYQQTKRGHMAKCGMKPYVHKHKDPIFDTVWESSEKERNWQRNRNAVWPHSAYWLHAGRYSISIAGYKLVSGLVI